MPEQLLLVFPGNVPSRLPHPGLSGSGVALSGPPVETLGWQSPWRRWRQHRPLSVPFAIPLQALESPGKSYGTFRYIVHSILLARFELYYCGWVHFCHWSGYWPHSCGDHQSNLCSGRAAHWKDRWIVRLLSVGIHFSAKSFLDSLHYKEVQKEQLALQTNASKNLPFPLAFGSLAHRKFLPWRVRWVVEQTWHQKFRSSLGTFGFGSRFSPASSNEGLLSDVN